MLKKTLFIMAAMFAVIAFQSTALAEPPAEAELTAEQAQMLAALEVALANAKTPEEKATILQDAITAAPNLASDPATSGRVLSIAQINGLSASQIDTAVVYGLALAYAAVQSNSLSDFFAAIGLGSNYTSGGGSTTSVNTASSAEG